MTDYDVRIGGELVEPASGWRLELDDRERSVGRLTDGVTSVPIVVEGAGTEWVVTLRGRRIPVSVRSWRERVMAEAETAAAGHSGPVEVRATLPGLVVVVAVSEGDEVAEGDPLLTLEAMKMQNEVRAPRAGTILEVAVTPGQVVATGALLMRLD